MTLLNPLYPSGEEMADVMVLHDHKVLLFQCKSKALTYRARIGIDFDALRNDLRKAIGESFEQGVRARNYLQNGKGNSFTVGRVGFALDMVQVNGVYLISVTSMPFQSLAARLANSNSALGLFSGDEYPWALSLGDLDIITQVLTTSAQFLHYVARRRQVERTSFSVYADEMDYLGFYLSHGMRFETDQFAGMDSVGLSGFSDDIERWVYEKFELGGQVDPPSSPMPEGFADFLSDVERSGDDYRTDCAMTLLELGSEGRKSFMQMIADTKDGARTTRAFDRRIDTHVKLDASYVNRVAGPDGFDAANLEKVIRLRQLLIEFHKHPFLRGKLVLKGGTAINLFYLDLARLSVDIDLNYIGQIERESMLGERPEIAKAVEQIAKALRYTVQHGANDHALMGWYLGYSNHRDSPDRIEVEINFLMRACALPSKVLPAVSIGDEKPCEFSVLAIEELFAGKIKAMIDRHHPRDLYDLFRFGSRWSLNLNPFVGC
jgi:predicted nucleotidyltransferase component of viral defense system